MPTARKTSFLLLAGLAAGVLALNLGSVVLAGLLSYMILDLAHRRLSERLPARAARWASLAVFLVSAVLLSWLFATFVRLALARTPVILASLLPKLDALALQYGIDLPFENLQDLREVVIAAVKENARAVTHASGLLTKGFFQVLLGIFVAAFCFLAKPAAARGDNYFEDLRREFSARMELFVQGVERILGAQVVISFINSGFTAIFLLAAGVPHVHFLTLATFIFGVVPIVGNVISNTMIVATALTVSPHLAVLSLVFLFVLHKTQYLLNSRILGAYLDAPMWLILLGLLLGESVMGIPGMILAPAVLHYVREELRALPPSR